jgi:hypothetical protein
MFVGINLRVSGAAEIDNRIEEVAQRHGIVTPRVEHLAAENLRSFSSGYRYQLRLISKPKYSPPFLNIVKGGGRPNLTGKLAFKLSWKASTATLAVPRAIDSEPF